LKDRFNQRVTFLPGVGGVTGIIELDRKKRS
jgi:hypothetical protein